MIKICRFLVLITFFACCHRTLSSNQPDAQHRSEQPIVEPNNILATLEQSHPRLMLKDKDMEKLKQQCAKDEILHKYVEQIISSANDCCQKPMLTYEKIGPRLLHVSRECLKRIYTLGLAWRWTGEEKYAKAATENLLTVCDFNDWNPSHFLDTAEMTHAVAVGYDWFFGYFDDRIRKRIKVGLIKHGMEAGMLAYSGQGAPWVHKSLRKHLVYNFNWNQVCNSGMLIGALAIAETDPEYAKFIVPRAVQNLPNALRSYGPDGIWPEGPMYWEYATRYTAYGLEALQSALGKDFSLSEIQGLSQTGYFPIYVTGPTDLFFNFADSAEENARKTMPCLFWLARKYNNSIFADAEYAMVAKYGADYEHIMWYAPSSAGKVYPKDVDRYFRGRVDVAVFRSSWDNPEALFVGVKAGYNQVPHAHLDLGNFELDALGVRWVRDLGSDNYNLPGYFAGPQKDSRRWTIYRVRSASHSVPLLGGKDQDPLAEAKVIKFKSEKSSAFVIIDLTQAYEEFANKVLRGVAVVQNRRAVLIQDLFEIKKPCEVAWGMTTDAEITIKEKTTAMLTLDGKVLIARLLSPADAEFTTESAEQQPPEAKNAGVKRLMLRLQGAEGSVQIAILLSPVWKDGDIVETVKLTPLARW